MALCKPSRAEDTSNAEQHTSSHLGVGVVHDGHPVGPLFWGYEWTPQIRGAGRGVVLGVSWWLGPEDRWSFSFGLVLRGVVGDPQRPQRRM